MFIKLWLISVYIFLYGDVLKLGSFTGSLRVWGLCAVSNMFLGVCLCACDIFFYWQNKINAVVYKFWLVGLRWPLTIAGSDLICRHCHLSVSVLVHRNSRCEFRPRASFVLVKVQLCFLEKQIILSTTCNQSKAELLSWVTKLFIKVGGTKNCN